MNKTRYAAVQNNVILDFFNTPDEALAMIQEEKKRDFLSIIFKKKLRRLVKRNNNIALHRYSVMTVTCEEDFT